MNFHNYQGQEYEATSSGNQGGRISFSGRGYHVQQMDHQRIDNRLTIIEEQNAAIQGTLNQHSQRQATMGNAITDIQ